MYNTIIFDLNGVFLQSQLLSQRFREEFQVPESEFLPALKQIMNVVRRPNAPSAFSFWKTYLDKWNIDLSEKDFFDFWFSGESLVPELVSYSQSLRDRGRKVFILSNNFRERTDYYRRYFPEIFSSVDKTYFSWETGFVKPSLEALTKIFQENKLQPSTAIYFDDSEQNVKFAQDLGIRGEIWTGLDKAKAIIEGKSGKEIK